MTTIDATKIERISDKTFDRVMLTFHVVMEGAERLLIIEGLTKQDAMDMAKYTTATAMLQLAALMHKKIGTDKEVFDQIVKESWEENDDPPSHRLKFVKGGG